MLIGALEASGIKMVCSIGNEQGNVLQTATFPTTTPEATIPKVVEFIDMFDVAALGIGSFGPLDLNPRSPAYGSITRTPKEEWCGYPLLSELKRMLHIPVAIDTDVNAAALAEHRFGAGKGLDSLLYVTVGAGIGGGFITGGRLVHGMVHLELGHMLLAPAPSDPMPDGVCPFHRHCLEGLASASAIEKRWGLPSKLMTEDHPAWDLEAEYLSQMCANAVLCFSPEIIVLGGSVLQQVNLLPSIREKTLALLGGYVDSERVSKEHIDTYIVPPKLGVNSSVTGALLLGVQALAQAQAEGDH